MTSLNPLTTAQLAERTPDMERAEAFLVRHTSRTGRVNRIQVQHFVRALYTSTSTRKNLAATAQITRQTVSTWLRLLEEEMDIGFGTGHSISGLTASRTTPRQAKSTRYRPTPAKQVKAEADAKEFLTKLDGHPTEADIARHLKSALTRDDAVRYLDAAIQQTTNDPKLRASLIEQRAKLTPDWRASVVDEIDPLKTIGRDGLSALEDTLIARFSSVLAQLDHFPAFRSWLLAQEWCHFGHQEVQDANLCDAPSADGLPEDPLDGVPGSGSPDSGGGQVDDGGSL